MTGSGDRTRNCSRPSSPSRCRTTGTVDGVVQIDQRYSAIHNQAYRIWRPLQVVVFLLLIGVGVMFVRWLRQAPASVEHPTAAERRLGHGRRAEDQDVRDVLARADRAERTARETKERLRELEAAVAAAPSTATATAALEELDLKLRASEAEREELAATVLRLQGSLSERDADVALARDGSGSRADTKRINKLIADAESKVVAAERKAAAADKKTQEAAKRASVTAERMLEMEAQLKEAEQKAADAQKFAATVDKRGSSAEKKVADAERRALEAEQKAKEIQERAAQAEQQVRELAGQAAEAEQRATASEQRAARAEQTIAATEQRAADAERKVTETAQLVTQAEGRASDAEKLASKVEQRAAEAERRSADAEERAVQAEQRAATAGGEDAGGKRRDSGERRIAAELKRTEGERDQLVAKIGELQRAFGEAQTRIETTERDLAVANLQVTNAAGATAASQALEERAQTAELRLADSEERFTDAHSRLAEAEAKLADALTQLEEANAPRPSLTGNELEARIAELESARRADVEALQRAQESFGNTQVELSNATRKLKEAEARVRELERGGHTRPAPAAKEANGDAAAVPDYVTASDEGRLPSEDVDDVEDGYPSLEAFGDGGAPHTWETTGPPPEPEPTVESPRRRVCRCASVWRGPRRAASASADGGVGRPAVRAVELSQRIDRVGREERRLHRARRQDPRHAVLVPPAELEMWPAQRDHPAASMPHDDLAVAGPVSSPQREAEVAEQPEPLGVRERRPEPVLVLHDPPPQRDRAEHRGVARPPELVRVLDGVEPARASELGPNVRPVPRARGLGRPPGWPGPAVAGDRREPDVRAVPGARERPGPPRLDRFGQRDEGRLEPGRRHRLPGRPRAVGLGGGGLGGGRLEVGDGLGQGERDGLDLDDPLRTTDVHAGLPRTVRPERTPDLRPPASGLRQGRTSLLMPSKSLK